MKRLFLATCLLLSSGPAYGEWLKVDTIVISQATVYAEDPSTIHIEGDLVKTWALFDFETERHLEGGNGSLVLSSKNQYEYKCAEKRQRLVAKQWFSGHMGSGKIVHQMTDEQRWTPVPTESPEHSLWMAACTKRLEASDPPAIPQIVPYLSVEKGQNG